MSKLYLVPLTIQEFAGGICWGSCGLGQIGAVGIDVGGGLTVECIPCREDECPYLDRQTDEPVGEVQGDPAYLRKLKAPEP